MLSREPPDRVSCLRQLQGMAHRLQGTPEPFWSAFKMPRKVLHSSWTDNWCLCLGKWIPSPCVCLNMVPGTSAACWAPSTLSWSHLIPEGSESTQVLNADLNLLFCCLLSASWVCNHMVRYRALCWGNEKTIVLFYKKKPCSWIILCYKRITEWVSPLLLG